MACDTRSNEAVEKSPRHKVVKSMRTFRLWTFKLSTTRSGSLPLPRHAKMRASRMVWTRRGARVAESTCLESMRRGNSTVGSNPTLSAIPRCGRHPFKWCLTCGRYARYLARLEHSDGMQSGSDAPVVPPNHKAPWPGKGVAPRQAFWVGFERGGSRGRSSPAWGDTRGLAPSVGARVASATSNAHPLRPTRDSHKVVMS